MQRRPSWRQNNTSGISKEITVNGRRLETVTSFKYRASLTSVECSKSDILSRTAQTTVALTRFRNHFSTTVAFLSFLKHDWCAPMYVLFCVNLCQDRFCVCFNFFLIFFYRKFVVWWLVHRVNRRQTEVCFGPDVGLCGWLGSKYQLANQLTLLHPSSCKHGPLQQGCGKEYEPWKWGATARCFASYAKTMLPIRKSVPRSSRQSDHTETSWPS